MTTPQALKERQERIIRYERGNLRLTRVTLVLLLVILVYQLAVVNPEQSRTNENVKDALTQVHGVLAVEHAQANQTHSNTLHSCQLSNTQLRRTVNRNIVRPLYDGYQLAGRLSPDFAPLLQEIHTIDYADCHHLYPVRGEPMPPFYRQAPLPKALTSN